MKWKLPTPLGVPPSLFRMPRALPRDASSLRTWRIYFEMNGLRRPPFTRAMLDETIRQGYLEWPFRISPWLSGAHICDIGCGNSLHAIGFLFCGAASYTGFDPALARRGSLLKDKRGVYGRLEASEFSPEAIQRRIPCVHFVPSRFAYDPGREKFDVVTMHNVTEHIPDLDALFMDIRASLRPGGWLLFAHPSFTAWSGHHMKPRQISEIVPDDPAQSAFIDWNHLVERDDWPNSVRHGQNRIRLHDLFRTVGRHFRIECWTERDSREKEGACRLTPEIEAAHPDYTRQDFLVKTVFVAAQPREQGGKSQ